jgi:hypothetical protein
MTRIVKDWRIGLMEAYPRPFDAPATMPEAARCYPTCGEGRRDLVERACARKDRRRSRRGWCLQGEANQGELWHATLLLGRGPVRDDET